MQRTSAGENNKSSNKVTMWLNEHTSQNRKTWMTQINKLEWQILFPWVMTTILARFNQWPDFHGIIMRGPVQRAAFVSAIRKRNWLRHDYRNTMRNGYSNAVQETVIRSGDGQLKFLFNMKMRLYLFSYNRFPTLKLQSIILFSSLEFVNIASKLNS